MMRSTIKALDRELVVLIEPAGDLPGQWVGHCLDLDIVSAGMSPEHALEMVTEAVDECIADDLANGLDPWARRPAPPEYYAALQRPASTLT
jgi:predicted RNase H-like HicB family nuclease